MAWYKSTQMSFNSHFHATYNNHMRTYRNDFHHFTLFDGTIRVDIVHLECPLKFFLGFSRRRDVDRQQEFLEVDSSRVVRIKCSEYVFAKLVCVPLREKT